MLTFRSDLVPNGSVVSRDQRVSTEHLVKVVALDLDGPRQAAARP